MTSHIKLNTKLKTWFTLVSEIRSHFEVQVVHKSLLRTRFQHIFRIHRDFMTKLQAYDAAHNSPAQFDKGRPGDSFHEENLREPENIHGTPPHELSFIHL